MAVSGVHFGDLYAVNAIRQSQNKFNQNNTTATSKITERDLHPVVKSDLGYSPFANKLDFLA